MTNEHDEIPEATPPRKRRSSQQSGSRQRQRQRVQKDVTEKARETYQQASEKAEEVSRTLWFLDFGFQQFVSTRLVRVLWILHLLGTVLTFIGVVGYSLWNKPVIQAVMTIVAVFLLQCIIAVFTRVMLELMIVIFRIAERLEKLE